MDECCRGTWRASGCTCIRAGGDDGASSMFFFGLKLFLRFCFNCPCCADEGEGAAPASYSPSDALAKSFPESESSNACIMGGDDVCKRYEGCFNGMLCFICAPSFG